MKSFLKLFYVLIVAIVVFTGALLIAQGMNEHGEKQEKLAAVEADTSGNRAPGLPDAMLSSGEGSAL